MSTGEHSYLFTGFPGFLGARLVRRLLELEPAARFECLVQERFRREAEDGVATLERDDPALAGRVRLMTGDITAPGLGLAAELTSRLRGGLRGAYHLAAVYDLAVSRALAQRVNVEGTRNVLEFLRGCTGEPHLHYVSTAYVSGTAKGVFRETDLDVGQSFKNHYEKTKFEAEVEVARSGLAHTVYRPGIVVGDSVSGETAKFDGPYFALRAMERLPSPGVFLRVGSGRNSINVIPVDFVVEAMARLSLSPEARGKTYHLTDPDPLPVAEVTRLFARALGRSFVFLPVPTAVAQALFRPPFVQSWLGLPRQAIVYFDFPCRYDAAVATEDLSALGIACPRLAEYAPRLVSYYQQHKADVRSSAMV